jgi:hypothetical protein
MPQEFPPKLRQVFKILPPAFAYPWLPDKPTSKDYVKPPDTGLFKAKLAIAECMRAECKNFESITIEVLIALVSRGPDRPPEGDVAWAIHHLAVDGLLEGRPPADWSPYQNPFGSTSMSEPGFPQIKTYQMPFGKGAVAPTEALWKWHRENDTGSEGGKPQLSDVWQDLLMMPPRGSGSGLQTRESWA